MNIDQLRYVSEAARSGSITQAAENLYISQPSVSEAIAKLEKELGEPLFHRNKKGVSLTAFGSEILPYIQNILGMVDQMPVSIASRNVKNQPRLSVCNGGYRYFAEAVGRLYMAHRETGIHVDFYDTTQEESVGLVSERTAEVAGYSIWDFQEGIILPRLERADVEFHSLGTSPVTISLGPNNPLFTREENWVTMEMIEPFPILYTFAEHSTLLYKKLGLSGRKNLIVCRSHAGRGELLNWTDCISVGGSMYQGYRKGTFYPNRRVFVLRGTDYLKQVGYLTKRDIPLSAIAREFADTLHYYAPVDDRAHAAGPLPAGETVH